MIVETKGDIVSEAAKMAYPDTGLYPEAIVSLARDAYDKGYAAGQAVLLPDRETLRVVVGGVLWNATNYPRKAQPYLLGTDTAPLTGKVVDAVLAALSTQPAAGEVETHCAHDENPPRNCAACGDEL